MTSKYNSNSGSTIAVNMAASVIIIAGMMAARSIVVPVLLALFLSIICAQPIMFLEKRKVPSILALLLVLTSLGLIFLLLGGIIGNSISGFVNDAPMYEAKLNEIVTVLIDRFNAMGMHIDTKQLFKIVEPGKVLSYTAVAAGELGRVLSDSFLIIMIMIFMLLEMKIFMLKAELTEKIFGNSLIYLNDIGVHIRHYLSIKTYISLLTGVLIWLWLLIMDVEYAVLWGLIAFLLNYIPTIGSVLAAVPTILFTLIQQGLEGMIWTAIGYLAIEMVIGNIIEPKVMGKGLGLSTLVVFLALIIWGFILGPVGMFLSIPLTITIKIILEQNERTRWLAVLLGTEKETAQMLNDI